MKVEREDLGGLKYRLTVEVGAADVRKHRERLARAYSHHVNLRGFRPGKAPIEMVIRQLGPSLELEVQEYSVSQAFQDALKEHALKPSTEPKVDIQSPGEDGSIRFTAEFESYPAVEVKDYLGIEVETPMVPEVADEDIEGTLERMRQSRGKFEDRPEDSVAHEGDMIVCELELRSEDGEAVLQERRETRVMAGSDDEPIVEIGRTLLGLKAGETKDVTGKVGRLAARVLERSMKKPAATDEAAEGEAPQAEETPVPETAMARVEVKRVLVKVLPELDDAFAREFGDEMTLEALRAQIRERLDTQRAEQVKDAWREAVVSAVLAANPIEIGADTIRRVAEAAQAEALEQLLPNMPAEERAKLGLSMPKEQGQEEARRNLARAVILQAIAEKEGVEVSEDDINAHLAGLAAQHRMPLPRLRAQLKEEQVDSLKRRLQLDKVLDMLQRYAVAKAPAAEAAAAEAPAAVQEPAASPEAQAAPVVEVAPEPAQEAALAVPAAEEAS